MLKGDYPKHDMNKVFDMVYQTIEAGGTDDNCKAEADLLMHLFAGLPAEAVECGMMFIHGTTDLPPAAQEIMPLYIRLVNLLEYCEKVESLRTVPGTMTTEEILARSDVISSLEEHEKVFGKPLMGFQINQSSGEAVKAEAKDDNEEESEDGSRLLLMNSQGAVFACEDPLKTALFYETKLGFTAAHLDDEAMPHIKLTRDNIALILVKASGDITKPAREFGVKYDMYIYCSEPYLMQNEIIGNELKIVEHLPDAKEAQKMNTNRQFVFEDCDGRHICVSQYIERF
ncbi:MAG: hypothetical protein IK128_03980 [Clostridiales bacterium]|nr:hypothetical protein [Clostridiales bacterium]